MEKIKSFQITGMTIAGFKSYGEPTNLVFGNPTVITGGNGRGKTSIADAIAFAVTGLPFFGERGIDRLHNEAQPDVSITMNFVDEAGTAHVLTRTRHKSTMSILYDGYTIRQMDLTELFGEKDVFLSIFNPLYFIEELGEDGKNLLERHLPLISHEAVLAQLSDATRAALENEPLLSPDTYLKKKRADIRELEETIIYFQGQKDLSETQGENREQSIAALTARHTALPRRWRSWRPSGSTAWTQRPWSSSWWSSAPATMRRLRMTLPWTLRFWRWSGSWPPERRSSTSPPTPRPLPRPTPGWRSLPRGSTRTSRRSMPVSLANPAPPAAASSPRRRWWRCARHWKRPARRPLPPARSSGPSSMN